MSLVSGRVHREWVAVPSSRVSSQPRNQIRISGVSCIVGHQAPLSTGFFSHGVRRGSEVGTYRKDIDQVKADGGCAKALGSKGVGRVGGFERRLQGRKVGGGCQVKLEAW